jgi:hypothetical protein
MPPGRGSKPPRYPRVFAMLGVAAVVGLLALLDLPICPIAAAFGQPCPACGLTRAALALLLGNVREAFAFHPLVFAVLPLVGAAAIVVVWPKAMARLGQLPGLPWLAGGFLVLLVAVWIARFAGAFGGPVEVLGPVWR